MGDEFDESSDVSSDVDVADTTDYSSDESYDTSEDSDYEIPEDTSIDEDVDTFDDVQSDELAEDVDATSEIEDSWVDENADEITEDTEETEIGDVSSEEFAEEIAEDSEEITEEASSNEYVEEINEDVGEASELDNLQADDSTEEINEDIEDSIDAEEETNAEYDEEIVEDTELSEESNIYTGDAMAEEDSDVAFTEEAEETTGEVTDETSDENGDSTAEENTDATATEELDEASDEITEESSDKSEEVMKEENSDVTSAEEAEETGSEPTDETSNETEDSTVEENTDVTSTEETEETDSESTDENSNETGDSTAEENTDVTATEDTDETSDEITEESGGKAEEVMTEEDSDITSEDQSEESVSEVEDTSAETEDGDSNVKVLKRNEYELLQSGNDAINQRLEAQADDYRDKGYSEEEIADKLAADKWRFQQEFLDDAFPGQEISPNVFNGFSENGAKDRIAEINGSDELREILQNSNGEQSMTESYEASYGSDVEPEKTGDIGEEIIDTTQEEVSSDGEQMIETDADYEKAVDQSDATDKLALYMSENNYSKDNFTEYSQDPQWRELQENAFGEFALQDETVESPMMRQVENQKFEALNDVSLSRDVTTNSDTPSDSQDIARRTEYLEKLKDYCEQQGYVGKADFSDFDPHVAYDLAKSVVDAKNDFPDLEVGYLGSISHQVEGIKKNIYDNQYNYYKSTGFSDEIASAIATQDAEDTIKSYGMDDTDGTYAWSFKSGVDIVDEYAGVAMNDQYAKDYDSFIASKQNDVLQKWAPVGCGTPKAVTDHELGHEIDKLLNASSDFEIREMYSEMMQAGNARDVLSQYSATNVQEFIAESYSEFRNNPSPRELSTRVYNRLIELRDQKIYRKGLVR